jgi:hypothetical protein
MFLLYLVSVIDFLASIIGLIRRNSFKNKGLKFFPIFLLIQFLDQFLTSRIFHFGANTWAYNIFMLFDMSCFAYLFYHLLEKSSFKKIVISLLIGFYVFYILDIFFLQNNGEYLSYVRSFMGFNLIVFSLLYFTKLFNSTKPDESLIRKAEFWIVIGVFFFYLTSTAILSITNYMVSLGPELLKYYNTDTMKYLAMGLYSSYIIGFLCHKSEQI